MQHLPYSKIMRIYRENQKLTLRDLSDKTFFGFQTLSKYEIELIPLSDENFEVIALALNIDFNMIYYINDKLKNDLDHLYECIVYDYTEEIEEILNAISQTKEYIKYSDLYHYYLVLMFALDVINGNEISSYLSDIQYMQNQIDSNTMQIFLDYYALYMNRRGKLNEGIDIINRALSIGKRPLISAMLHYHSGLLNSLAGNLKTSLEHNLEAEHLFIQEHNHIRLISVQTNIATIYARQKNLDKALEIYVRLLKEAIRSKNLDIEIVTRYNIASCYNRMNKFEDSNKIIDEIELILPLTINGYYIKANNLISLNQQKEAQLIINHCLKLELDSLFQLKFELLDYENNYKQNEEYCHKLKDFLQKSKLSYDYENTEFVLDKLIDYYEYKFAYKIANVYLKEKILFIENKFSK